MGQDVTSIAIVAVILLLRIASCSIAEVLDVTLDPRQRKNLLSLNAIIASLALANWFVGSVMHNEAMRLAITATTAYVYAVCPAIFAQFLSIMDASKKQMRVVWGLVMGNALLYASAFFCPLTFYYASDNHLHYGPLGHAARVVAALFILQIAYIAIREFRKRRLPDDLLPIFGALIIICSVALDDVLKTSNTTWFRIVTLSMPIASDAMFLWVHLTIAREYKEALLVKQRTQLAVSQIQPHFLYNTLTGRYSIRFRARDLHRSIFQRISSREKTPPTGRLPSAARIGAAYGICARNTRH
ncbi:MAG: histidine kinase [Atopobiaceae bacterium]|nr:histidine kinase [Atopobiaceae bacterium]